MEQQRKRIAFLSPFYPYRGGIAQSSASIYRALEKRTIIRAFNYKRQYPNFLFPGQSQFVTDKDAADPIPSERQLDSIQPFSYGATARSIKQFRPDVFLFRYWMTFFGPSLGTVSKYLRKNSVRICILDNLIPHEKRFFDRPFNHYFLKHTDGFVVMSESVKKDLLAMKPDAKYLQLFHPIYDHFGVKLSREAALQHLKLPSDKRYLLFFGIIRDYKGLDVALEALPELPPDVHLIVAGEPYTDMSKFHGLVEKLHLTGRVHWFNEYIADDHVSPFFSVAEACLLPYKSATQSGIAAIAYHFDLPIIATNVGGLKEIIVEGKTGFVANEITGECFASKVTEFFKNPLHSNYQSEIQEFKTQLTWDYFAEALLGFIDSFQKKTSN